MPDVVIIELADMMKKNQRILAPATESIRSTIKYDSTLDQCDAYYPYLAYSRCRKQQIRLK